MKIVLSGDKLSAMSHETHTLLPSPPERDPLHLSRERFDVLIIGGGINGCGLARDLVLRNLRVALVEKGDIACATSSASTKLVHGGVRYLEQYAFPLVFEACRERRILQRIAPHLVHPLPFFIPVYQDDPRPLWMVRAGMALYDLMALFRNTRRHSILSPRQALEREPSLQDQGLSGVALYWDCRMDDARLCLENALAAQQGGAEVLTYAQVVSLLHRRGRIRGAVVLDRESGTEIEVEAKVVVNAAGPWLDRICSLEGEHERRLRPTRGTHILVPRINRGEEALYLTAGRDQRLFFVIPWGELSLIGTTDVDFDGDPDSVAPTEEDVDYLLAEANRHLRGTDLCRAAVVASFAGLRPLVRQGGAASGVSREHEIFESDSGLLSVGGGKYTTYRAVAEELADRICERLGRSPRRPGTDRLALPGGGTGNFTDYLTAQRPELAAASGLAPARVDMLLRSYGSRTPLLIELLCAHPELAQPVSEGSDLLAVQVVYAAKYELARTAEDILRRRTQLALGPGRGLKEVAAVSSLLGACLEADDDRQKQWVSSYRMCFSHIFS